MAENKKSTSCNQSPRFDAINVPVHRASTVLFGSTDEFLTRKSQLYDGYSYGLYGTPTTRALEEVVANVEGGLRSILVPSGLAALTHSILALMQAGDHLLVADCVYGPTRDFCTHTLKRLGISVSFFPADASSVAQFIQKNTRMVLLESPGSFSMEIQEISTICREARSGGALVMVDNTWGFGISKMPTHGVDIVATALSKYAAGHSDVCMGSVTVSDEGLYRKLKSFIAGIGSGVSSDDAYLVSRGICTLDVRLQAQAARALEFTTWLRSRPEVQGVLNPADPLDGQHGRFKAYFSGGNGLVSVMLQSRGIESIRAMVDGFKTFKIGASWGGTTSLVSISDLSAVRSVELHEPATFLLRFHFGLESMDDLYADLEDGFQRIAAPDKRLAI